VADVKSMLQKHDFFDIKTSRAGRGIDHDFQKKGEIVYDAATGLTWQQSGSSRDRLYEKAHDYVKELNDQKFAGFSDWRLPTLEEAMSLMEPKRNEVGLFINPVFDKTQEWIYTADKEPGARAWDVLFGSGGCAFYDGVDADSSYVRAVR